MSVRFAIHAILLSLAVLLAVQPGTVSAGALGIGEVELAVRERLDQGDASGAAELVRDQLDTTEDPRLQEDLLAMLADFAERSGDLQLTAEALVALADSLGDRQPPPGERAALYARAASALVTDGSLDEALEQYRQGLLVAVEAGLDPVRDAILVELRKLLEQSNDPALADNVKGLLSEFTGATSLAPAAITTGRDISVEQDKGYALVDIYYATDRARDDETMPGSFYAGSRGELEYGTAKVSIPLTHKPGQIETASYTTFFREDPMHHIVLQVVNPTEPDGVFAQMRDQLNRTGSDEAFVFVHGFNVTFSEAAKRTAQIAYDMQFSGLPFLFSWPSQGNAYSYISDTAVVRMSGRRLLSVLKRVVAESGAKRIHLIAHSMGNRAMTDALELFALEHKGKPPAFEQLLLTAPDLDAGLFEEMLKTIRPVAARTTLYASNNDWALTVSRQLHGNAPRAGQGGENIVTVQDVDSIEMSALGDDMLAHSYFANDPSALMDILSLFWRDVPPDKRCGLQEATGERGEYWQYDPSICDGNAMLLALRLIRQAGVQTLSEARALIQSKLDPEVLEAIDTERLEAALIKLYAN